MPNPPQKVPCHPPYLDPDSLAAEFYQIFKQIKIMPILHTCIWNVFIEVERIISQLILWGSITTMPKPKASSLVQISLILLHPIFAHDEFYVLHLWQENDGNDTLFISSHSIRRYMISVCPNTDDDHLDHLNKVVAVKILHCQVTLPYLGINTFFSILKDINILFFTKL